MERKSWDVLETTGLCYDVVDAMLIRSVWGSARVSSGICGDYLGWTPWKADAASASCLINLGFI
jgi:hypothetical protein